MDWPPRSLDLNITEASGGSSWQRIEQKAASIQNWALNVQEAWRTNPEVFLKKLQQSFTKKIQAVLENKVGHAFKHIRIARTVSPCILYFHVCISFNK